MTYKDLLLFLVIVAFYLMLLYLLPYINAFTYYSVCAYLDSSLLLWEHFVLFTSPLINVPTWLIPKPKRTDCAVFRRR